eukprot:snap_masked-scaffold_24-processed-gene-5.32-mRNA-1 protein AED:1.00 eAED:1.00 QI:0/-1/0/0/-1/1/1/0/143
MSADFPQCATTPECEETFNAALSDLGITEVDDQNCAPEVQLAIAEFFVCGTQREGCDLSCDDFEEQFGFAALLNEIEVRHWGTTGRCFTYSACQLMAADLSVEFFEPIEDTTVAGNQPGAGESLNVPVLLATGLLGVVLRLLN